MSNEIMVAPQYVPAVYNVKAVNDEFSGGLPQSVSFPRIGLSGKQFVKHVEGTSEVITGSFTDQVGNQVTVPLSVLKVVIVRGKPTIDKTYYINKFNPNETETKSPDCFSRDGLQPDPSSTVKQCDSCAQCPHNQFGSGLDQSGNPTKGKACADTKMLAVYGQGGIYGFKIPSASLKNFNAYLKTLSGYGLTPPAVITKIGFDPAVTYSVLTFTYDGALDETQMRKIADMRESQEVMDIVGGVSQGVQTSPAAVTALAQPSPSPFDTPAAQVVSPAAQVVSPAAQVAPSPFEAPLEAPKKKTAQPKAEKVTPISEAVVVAPAAGPSEEEMRNALGL